MKNLPQISTLSKEINSLPKGRHIANFALSALIPIVLFNIGSSSLQQNSQEEALKENLQVELEILTQAQITTQTADETLEKEEPKSTLERTQEATEATPGIATKEAQTGLILPEAKTLADSQAPADETDSGKSAISGTGENNNAENLVKQALNQEKTSIQSEYPRVPTFTSDKLQGLVSYILIDVSGKPIKVQRMQSGGNPAQDSVIEKQALMKTFKLEAPPEDEKFRWILLHYDYTTQVEIP